MRCAVVLVALLALDLALAAAAHLDVDVGSGDESFALAPGESRGFAFDVHYHRLVGRVEVDGAPVVLAVFDDAAFASRASGSAAFWRSAPLSGARGLNVLVDCCDGASYSEFHLVIEHAGVAGAANVRVVAKAAHDDLLVGMSGAEGDVFQNSVVFWLVGGTHTWRLVRARRAPVGGVDAPAALRRSVLLLAAPLGVASAAAAWGVARYGGGVTAGAVAAAGRLLPSFGIAALVLVFLAAWAWSAAVWTRAQRHALAVAESRRGVLVVGAAAALLVLAMPFLLSVEYGPRVLAIGCAMALPLAAPFIVGCALLVTARRPAAT